MVTITVAGRRAWVMGPLTLAMFVRFLVLDAGYWGDAGLDEVAVETV
jgi:hypothetical protein